MSSYMSHCSSSQLHAYVDRRLSADETMAVNDHLGGCHECQMALQTLECLDSAIRSIPLERVDADFTSRVMSSLYVAQKSPFLFRVVEKVAYVFGLFIVAAIMVAAFLITGVIDITQVTESESVATEVLSKSGESLVVGFRTLGGWINKYWSFAFGKGSFGISFFIFVIAVVLGAVDKLFSRWFVHRLR